MAVIRKGMKVRSIYEPDRVFTVDRSLLPGRVFHEKGAARWYSKHELLPATASQKAVKPLTQQKKLTAQNVRSLAFLGIHALTPKQPYQPKYRCTECGTEFTRAAKSRKLRPGERPFCSTAHRVKFWKRLNVLHISTPKSTGEKVEKGAA